MDESSQSPSQDPPQEHASADEEAAASEEGAADGEHGLRRILRAEESGVRWRSLLILIVSVGVSALAMGMTADAGSVGLILAVLLFHELGHFVGMRAFGYRDVRMFFLPFIGAAVTGTSSGVSAARRAIVLLLGPVPGIVLAFALALFARNTGHDWVRHAASMLAVLNALNLLPLEPFDGGKLAFLVVSSRHRILDLASLALGGMGIAYLAFKTSSFGLGFIALMSWMALPQRLRLIRSSRALRESGVPLPDSIDQAPDATLDVVEKLALDLPVSGAANEMSQAWRDRRVAENARWIYDRAITTPPRFAVSAALIAVQVLALIFAFMTVVPFVGVPAGEKRPLTVTKTSTDGGISLHLPTGFHVQNDSPVARIAATRTVEGTQEGLAISTSPHAASTTLERGVASILRSFEQKPAIHDAHLAGSCHGGDGRSIEFTKITDRATTRHFLCVVDAGGNQFGMIELIAATTIYDAEKPVLLEILDAVTFSAPADAPAPP